MATLEITYDELRRDIGRYLFGYRDETAITGDDTTDISDILRSGLRMFYYPHSGHVWSFMKQSDSITTTSGTYVYPLPESFAVMTSPLTYDPDKRHLKIEKVDEVTIRSQHANADASAPPHYFAVRAKPIGDGQRTRHELVLYPNPDDEYVLTYRYLVEPLALSESNERPLGGAVHSETILSACLYAAEKMLNPEAIETRGGPVHGAEFEKHLAGSIALDSLTV